MRHCLAGLHRQHATALFAVLLLCAAGDPRDMEAQRLGAPPGVSASPPAELALVPLPPAAREIGSGQLGDIRAALLAQPGHEDRVPGPEQRGGFRPLAAIPVWASPAMSAVLPGAGQLRLGQDRFAAYLLAEAYFWLRYARHRSDGRRGRDGYRELAAEVARSPFAGSPPVGTFDYYERMENFIESGAFDASDELELQPEPDESTFNGFIWRRARETFWQNPSVPPPPESDAYQRAMSYYMERAVTQQYRWSWRNAQLEHDLFRKTISASNDAFQRSTQDLGLIIANHALSMVDALISVRIRVSAGNGDSGYTVTATIPFGGK